MKKDTKVRLEVNGFGTVLGEVGAEYVRAARKFPPMNSPHEGYAVILEELDELKAEIWKSTVRREMPKMRREAIQVAAMAIRFVIDLCEAPEVRMPAGFVDNDPDGDHANEDQRGGYHVAR